MATKLIAGGAWIQVVFNGQPVGLCQSASYDEDWVVNPANVLNYLGPCDYDSQGYSCTLSLGTFIPEVPGSGPWPDGGGKALADYLPIRRIVQSNQGKPGMIDTIQFLNTATGAVVNQFRGCMIASNGTQIAPNSFATANIRLMCIERVI